MMIKYAIVLAVVLVLAAVFTWAFLPARHLPGNRARHLRIRLHLRLHPGKGFAHAFSLHLRWGRLAALRRSGCAPGSSRPAPSRPLASTPLGLVFPSPTGRHWRSSNFNRNVLKRAYLAAGWRDAAGRGGWTWHSLRYVFCTTALFTWKLDATDVSRMAGHANYRITLDTYVGTTAGVLDRARTVTQ
jgi:hypothetical protein